MDSRRVTGPAVRVSRAAQAFGYVRTHGEVGLSVILGLQVAIMFVIAPLAATGALPAAVVDVFRIGLAAAALLTLTHGPRAVVLIAAPFALSLALSFTLTHGLGASAVYLFRLAVTSAFDVAVAVLVARVVFGPGEVTVHRILGGVILYLSVGLIFANAYRAALVLLNPSFRGLPPNEHSALSELLYFSLSTLTTTGFGDIVPVHPFVRSLANLEAVIGQLYPATLLARLVTLHAAKRLGSD